MRFRVWGILIGVLFIATFYTPLSVAAPTPSYRVSQTVAKTTCPVTIAHQNIIDLPEALLENQYREAITVATKGFRHEGRFDSDDSGSCTLFPPPRGQPSSTLIRLRRGQFAYTASRRLRHASPSIPRAPPLL